jgi:DNA polymerase I-like protein with 3'-5' exonuclease and polymerase domains
MLTVIDIETTTNGPNRSPSPYLPGNYLVSVGFDLSWIQECGWEYNGEIYDTMIYEYVKAGGLKTIKFGLDASCRRYGIDGKTDEIKEYFDIGIGFEAIPWKMVEQYGRNDVDITRQLYEAQQCELSS